MASSSSGRKGPAEMALLAFLPLSVLAYYYANVVHVLPRLCRPPSVGYAAHVLPLTFVVFNALANFVAVARVDSSVVGRRRLLLLLLSERASKGTTALTVTTYPVYPDVCFEPFIPCVCVWGRGNSTFSKGYVTKESTEYLVLYRFSRRGGIHFFSLGWSRPLDTTSNQGGPGWARPP